MSQGKSVLLVEDDPAGRAVWALILGQVGHEVRCAADGEEALNLLRARRPDVIVLDLFLPRVDGWEFRRRQRQDPDLAGVPVVVVSGTTQTPCCDERLGEVIRLTKPIEVERLLEAIENATTAGACGNGRRERPIITRSDPDLGRSGPHPVLLRQLRVLVVDDDATMADLLAGLAARWGHDVRVCLDGGDALTGALVYDPDVVLLDLNMPPAGGAAVARWLRARPRFRPVPIIAVTGHTDDVHRAEAADAGVSAYLVKPVDPEQLRELLDDLGR